MSSFFVFAFELFSFFRFFLQTLKEKLSPTTYQQTHPERVNIHPVVVVLVIELRSHKLRRTQHRLRRRPRPQKRRQTQIANLDDPLGAVDEDVVAFQVAVDDRRGVAVQIDEPAQNLPCPPLQDLDVDRPLVLFAVLPQSARGEKLGDKIHGCRAPVVKPAVVEGHDVAVLKLLQHADFREQPVALGRAARVAGGIADELGDPNLVPGDLCAFFLVKGLVNGLEGPAAEDLVELEELFCCLVCLPRECFLFSFAEKFEGGRRKRAGGEKRGRKKKTTSKQSHPAVAPRGVGLDHLLFLLLGLLFLLALWHAGRRRRLRLRLRRGRRRRHCCRF